MLRRQGARVLLRSVGEVGVLRRAEPDALGPVEVRLPLSLGA
jgi:hypothetical protein